MAEANVLQFTVKFHNAGACVNCGVEMVMPEWFYSARRSDHKSFYCVNGHSQFFVGQSDAEKLREELERERQRTARAEAREASLREVHKTLEHRLNGTKGALTKIKKRVAGGCCPACKRSFGDLGRHMKAKHPDFAGEGA